MREGAMEGSGTSLLPGLQRRQKLPIELKHLRYVDAAERYGSFRKAADSFSDHWPDRDIGRAGNGRRRDTSRSAQFLFGNGAPRSMKMGTTPSRSRCDVGAYDTPP
jgi:hypothetical protein